MSQINFKGLNILIIGDVMVDRYVFGQVNRISPEAPIPVLSKTSADNKPGGAANVALNIKALGASPFLVGMTGNDLYAEKLKKSLEYSGITTEYLISSENRQTTLKSRFISGGQHLLRVDAEDIEDIRAAEENLIYNQCKNIVTQNDIHAFILQDYNKGLLTADLIPRIIQLAAKSNIPVIVDPKFKNFFSYKYATVIKPNKLELEKAFGNTLSINEIKRGEAIKAIKEKLSCETLFVTLSGEGIIYAHEKQFKHIPTKNRDIIDVCGAGDTVLSILACGIASHMNLDEIAHLSNIGGGQVCESPGVVSVDLNKLNNEFYQGIPPTPSSLL